MAGMSSDVEVLKDIPGYKAILKSVLKSQIQMLVEQLSEHTGEETILLTASVHDGTLSHQGSNTGRGFLEGRDEIKSQFLGYCLKSHHKKKVSETRSSPYQRPQSGIQGERTPSNQGPSKKVPRLQLQPQPVSLQRVVAGDSGLGPGLRPPDMQRAPSQVFDENRAESSAVSVKLESNDSSVTSSDLDNYSSATVTFSSSVQHDQSLTSGDVHSENNESQNSAEDSTERTSDNEDTSATSACIKIEPINENEMELEITGVEPGKVTTPTDSWSHTQSNFGAASTSGPVEPGTSDSIYMAGCMNEGIPSCKDQYSRRRKNTFPRQSLHKKTTHPVSQLQMTTPPALQLQMATPPGPPLHMAMPPGGQIHTEAGEWKFERKLYNCSFCDKKWRTPSLLQRHLLTHTGERPHICIECGQTFKQKAHLDGHYIRSHQEKLIPNHDYGDST